MRTEIFLLTRPSRDVTEAYLKKQELAQISTHTSLAGRDRKMEGAADTAGISTHTSLAGRDTITEVN